MFEDCSLLAMIDTSDKSIQIRRITEDSNTQKTISQTFATAAAEMKKDRAPVAFDGKYHPQPEDMEYLVIAPFVLPSEIKEALRNPQGLELYSPESGKLPPIKALFVGKCEKNGEKETIEIAFQKFKKDQYITAAKHHLLFSNNTFTKETKLGISVGQNVDCVFEDSKLYFRSYYYARQIFDLSDYYRTASIQDLQVFVDNASIQMEKKEGFIDEANEWERRRIAAINDSGLFEQYRVNEIKKLAKETDITLNISKGKIMIPEDKKERRVVLGFLAEEVYKGAFSKRIYQTNSKRVAQ